MFATLTILNPVYLKTYQERLSIKIAEALPEASPQGLPMDSFSFYTSVSAAYSSKIEGEDIEVDSYLKSVLKSGIFEPNYTKKTDDLLAAYQFAKKNSLKAENVLRAHELISQNLLLQKSRGKIRNGIEYILNKEGRIEYVAAPPDIVKSEWQKLFLDIEQLLEQILSLEETFYFASMIHLVFLKIHPFEDGNGRTARLLEKWFLAEKIGAVAWFISSERYYYENLKFYYKNVHIGLDYQSLDYERCVPFLLMLTKSLFKS